MRPKRLTTGSPIHGATPQTSEPKVRISDGFGIYGGYEIASSNGRGGKAGTGHNKTATIQVREPFRPGEYLLKAQFRYKVASRTEKENALSKARAWIDAQHLTTKMPNDPSSPTGGVK